MALVTITQGRDFEFTAFLVDQDKKPVDITGQSLVKMEMKKTDGNKLTMFAPLTPAVNEIQTITFPTTPTSGAFKLDFGNGNITTAINFNDNAAAIQAIINALKIFSSVVVTGVVDQATGLTLTYSGNDGGRNQAEPLIDTSTLSDGSPVVPVVTETVVGVAENGIDVVSEARGELKIKGSEAQSILLKADDDQTAVFIVRIGAKDLNIPPAENFHTVLADPLV